MKIAKKTDNESARIDALLSYGILDTERDKVLDDITQMIADICDCPIALISLVDEERQWFKSKNGITIDCIDRDIAFCSHAILQDEVFEIRDALLDERFSDNPLVLESPHIRFYAGVPLTSPSGFNIGTVCVVNDRPRTLTSTQKHALITVSNSIMAHLEINRQQTKLILSNQYKASFLSNVSHEIRTPLNAIIGLSDLMLKDQGLVKSFPLVNDYLCQIDESGKQMLKTINAVLEMGKIDAGHVELEPKQSNIVDYIARLIDTLNIGANEKGISIKLCVLSDVPIAIEIDEAKVGYLLTNLINNAVKFSDSSQTVTVNLSINTLQLYLSVVDQGLGIPTEKLHYIFNQYNNRNIGNKKNQGIGLGLSITKGLVDLMSGSITINSERQKGTQVDVTLPFKLAKIMDTVDKDQTQHRLVTPAGFKVLVIEDSKLNQVVISALLSSLNISFDIAETGEEGLELTSHKQYELIFMDIHLPGIDGVEATRRLKSRGVTSPILALTADVYRPSREKALFDSFLTKPINLDALSAAIQEHLPKQLTC